MLQLKGANINEKYCDFSTASSSLRRNYLSVLKISCELAQLATGAHSAIDRHRNVVLNKCPECADKVVSWNIKNPNFLKQESVEKVFKQIKYKVKELVELVFAMKKRFSCMVQGPLRASLDDFDSIIELVNECFPRDRDQGGMLARWPHCYIPRPEKLRNCLVIKDGPKVVSLVEYVDQTVLVEENEIKVAGVTGVSTWPTYRGRGFMTRLLKYCISLMHKEGYAFSDLGGDRQRYGRFGWEEAGRQWRFQMTKRSLRAVNAPLGFDIEKYNASSNEVDAIITMHERESLRMKRTRSLYEMLLGREGKQVWLAHGSAGIAAYVVARPKEKEQDVVEFGGNSQGVHAILRFLIEDLGSEELCVFSPWSHPLNGMFLSISSWRKVRCLRMIKILDLETTLRAFAPQLMERYRDLGFQGNRAIALGVRQTGQQIEIKFSPDEVNVKKSSSLRPLVLSEQEMVRLIFGPGSPSTILYLPSGTLFLDALFPVNFHIWENETV